jgi:hypothetical protein
MYTFSMVWHNSINLQDFGFIMEPKTKMRKKFRTFCLDKWMPNNLGINEESIYDGTNLD